MAAPAPSEAPPAGAWWAKALEKAAADSVSGDPAAQAASIQSKLASAARRVQPFGFEVHPFNVRHYNALVADIYHLKAGEADAKDGEADAKEGEAGDALGIVLLTTPAFWGPFCDFYAESKPSSDAVDEFANGVMKLAAEELGGELVTEAMDPQLRRPRVLVQTAGHVAGAAHYYTRESLADTSAIDAWASGAPAPALGPLADISGDAAAARPAPAKKVFPVAVHPRWGGYFAYRGVIICRGTQVPALGPAPPPNPCASDDMVTQALIKFNEGWVDRAIPGLDVEAAYDPEASLYFNYLKPKEERAALLEEIIRRGGRRKSP